MRKETELGGDWRKGRGGGAGEKGIGGGVNFLRRREDVRLQKGKIWLEKGSIGGGAR